VLQNKAVSGSLLLIFSYISYKRLAYSKNKAKKKIIKKNYKYIYIYIYIEREREREREGEGERELHYKLKLYIERSRTHNGARYTRSETIVPVYK
jgi:hypothetical protein